MMYRLDACFIHFRCMYRSQVHVSNLYKRIEINVHVPVNLTVALQFYGRARNSDNLLFCSGQCECL